MNLELYFPTPVWWEDTTIDPAPMLELLTELKERSIRSQTQQRRRLAEYGF